VPLGVQAGRVHSSFSVLPLPGGTELCSRNQVLLARVPLESNGTGGGLLEHAQRCRRTRARARPSSMITGSDPFDRIHAALPFWHPLRRQSLTTRPH
jgi:hypothetical protein